MAEEEDTSNDPIGKSDQPNSPTLDRGEEVCHWDGNQYASGAKICIDGNVHRCKGGVWRRTKKFC